MNPKINPVYLMISLKTSERNLEYLLEIKFLVIFRMKEDGNYAATVFYSEKTGYRIEYWGQSNELADIPRGVARAYFRMDVETTG